MLQRLRVILLPFSALFWLVIRLRHLLFDWGIVQSQEVNCKTICVGNITVGGTGKTPHVEHLIGYLSQSCSVAMLSRGYRRKTKGFLMVETSSQATLVGDEPLQIKTRYPSVLVAVDEKRVRGARQLLLKHPEIQAIILDDAFQHRYIKPGMSVVLIDYSRPVWSDYLLPAGNLRDLNRELRRAQVVLVTKCPGSIGNNEMQGFKDRIGHKTPARLFFTTYAYGAPTPVFEGKSDKMLVSGTGVVGLAGIANPVPFREHLSRSFALRAFYSFPDHHLFSKSEIWSIFERFSRKAQERVVVVTTEKDAMRIRGIDFQDDLLKASLYFIPIRVEFLNGEEVEFNRIVENYVRTGQANNRVH